MTDVKLSQSQQFGLQAESPTVNLFSFTSYSMLVFGAERASRAMQMDVAQ